MILSIGVRPEAKLAEEAGLEIGERAGIKVDEAMRTSDSHIWAVGDAVESRDYVIGGLTVAPLAGPANRQGRIAADSICGREVHFRGVQATAVVGIFGLTVAMTGVNEKMLRRFELTDYEVIYLHPGHHVAYFPGAKPIHIKIVFSKTDGRILGAQAVGEEGVERRIDVIAMAIQKNGTVFDLEEAELCYAPQYGAAKDPVNMAGMVASNVMRGDLPLAPWDDVSRADALLLDVRDPAEYEAGHVENAINIPLPQLRNRIEELPRDHPIWVYCGVGKRSYYAVRVLLQHGFQLVRNLPGGFTTFKQIDAHNSREKQAAAPSRRTLGCSGPVDPLGSNCLPGAHLSGKSVWTSASQCHRIGLGGARTMAAGCLGILGRPASSSNGHCGRFSLIKQSLARDLKEEDLRNRVEHRVEETPGQL